MFSFLICFFLNISYAQLQMSYDFILSGQNSEVIDSDINPLNQVLTLPSEYYDADFRSEVKYRTRSNQVIVRPRWQGYSQKITNQATNQTLQEAKGKIDLTDAFIETNWNAKLSTTLGLQVYQWGPAEILNPSNSLFHFNSKQRGLFYKEKGQVLIRSNWSLNKENILVLAIEPISNAEPEWIDDDKFVAKFILKYEKSWLQTANYFGLVAGSEEKSNFYVGEYFNFSPIEGFSIYSDLKHPQYQQNYEPVFNGFSYDMEKVDNPKNQWQTLAVAGLRWESNFDIRLEYIYNSMGFDKNKLINARLSASNIFSAKYAQNLKRYFKSGLELLGQEYLYASLRVSEPFDFKDFNFYTRTVYSLQDQSSQLQIEFDKSFLDSWTGFASQSFSYGEDNSEFRLLNSWQTTLGLKLSL